MKLLAFFAFFVVVSARKISFDPLLDEHWDNFKKAFDKHYTGREEAAGRLIWEEHVAKIIDHNLRADVGLLSYKRTLNEYADMSHQEFVMTFNGYSRSADVKNNASSWINPSSVELPAQVDWREDGFVTPVKTQGLLCSACWAFSTTGSLEGQHKKKTGKLVSLSAQNLIDCSRSQGNYGCESGWMDKGFEYVKENGGIDTEESYPYTGRDGACHFKKSNVGATCTGYVQIPSGDEQALQKAVATVGPISVYIDASHETFQTYGSGIYNEPGCSSEDLDHAVLVVGYGTEDGQDYWLVKNCWGTTWGDKGYIKMSRNKNNQCGIATQASYPLV